MQKKLIAIAILILLGLILLSGCLTKFNPTVEVNEQGSGTVFIQAAAMSEIDSEIQDMLGDKKNLQIDKSRDDDYYYYDISFEFDDIKEVSKNAILEITEKTDRTTYKYTDEISAETIVGKQEQFIDFKYCIKLPGKVIKFIANNINDTTYNGKYTACVNVKGDKDDPTTTVELVSEKLKEGCEYNNPACSNLEECINNKCVLKEGCNYNNQACAENQDCINNQCLLKQGCDYGNPACQEGFECVENQCKQEVDLGMALLGLVFLLILAGVVGGGGYFAVKRIRRGKKAK